MHKRLIFVFVFCISFVSAASNISTISPTSSVLGPWMDVDDFSLTMCKQRGDNIHVKGAFYLNHDALVGCQDSSYKIKISIKKKKLFFDETLKYDQIYSSCNYWDLEDDPLAPLKVSFDHHLGTLNTFLDFGENEDIYFEAEVIEGPEDFEYNFNGGHIVRSDFYDVLIEDCSECSSGDCCVDGFLKPVGSQPVGVDDFYYCSGYKRVFSEEKIMKKDYYCDGASSEHHVSLEVIDSCGSCQYCESGYSYCFDYASGTEYSYSDCDHLDTDCRDYHDVKNVCDGSGNVNYFSCTVYDNLPVGTSCSSGECDGFGNCVGCASHAYKKCAYDNVYWFDSCDEPEEIYESCEFGCYNSKCLKEDDIVCFDNSDCEAEKDSFSFCDGDESWMRVWRSSCDFGGTRYAVCEDSYHDVFIKDCELGCSEGKCKKEVRCYDDYDCNYNLISQSLCEGDYLVYFMNYSYCMYPGYEESYCMPVYKELSEEECEFGCVESDSGGRCDSGDIDYSFSLEEGWNLISFPYDVSSMSLSEVFSDCWDFVEEVKDEKDFYSKSLPSYLNTLDMVEMGRGYWVLSSSDCEATFDVFPESDCEIEFKDGWNLIGPVEDDSLDGFFGSNFGFVEEVKDEKDFYSKNIPSYLNTLSDLEKGEGYWVLSSENFSLEF